MADDDESESEGKGKGKKKDKKGKGKSNLVPAVVLGLCLVVAGRMLGSKPAPDPASAGVPGGKVIVVEAPAKDGPMDCAAEDLKSPPTAGGVFKLDPISINLANDHYAKVGIALELSSAVNLEEFKAESEAYKALDVVISTIGGRDMAEFGSPQSLETLKEKLTEEVRPKFDCKVLEVLFTEFVMQ